MSYPLNLLFFGPLSEFSFGKTHQLQWQPEYTTPEMLLAAFSDDAELIESLKNPGVQVIINKKVAEWGSAINSGDDIAFLPPVSGG